MEENERGKSWMRHCELYLDNPENKEELDSLLAHTEDFNNEMTFCALIAGPSIVRDISTDNVKFISGALHNALLMGYWLGKNNMAEPPVVTEAQLEELRTGCICEVCKADRFAESILGSHNDPRTS